MLTYGVLVFVSALVIVLLLGLILGLHILLDEPISEVYEHFSYRSLKIIFATLIVSEIINLVAYFQADKMFTSMIYGLEGSIALLFQDFTHPLLTVFFIVSYLVFYPLIIIMTYFKLHSVNEGSEMKYAGSYILLLVMSAPFFYFFPVEVTGYYLEGARPLLYEFHPYINQSLTAFDPLTKAFPSLHTGISVLAFVYAYKYSTARYSWVIGFITASIIVSTFYLGVHWISDAVLGAILALLSFYLVDEEVVTASFIPEWILGKFTDFLKNISENLDLDG